MAKVADIQFNQHTASLTGELDFSNVMQIYKKSLLQLKRFQTITFDFSKLTSANSAGLGLVIEWIKYAKRHRKTVTLQHLPDNLLAIARAAGIESLLS